MNIRIGVVLAGTLLLMGTMAFVTGCASLDETGPVKSGRPTLYADAAAGTQPATAPAEESEGQNEDEVWARIAKALGRKGTANNSVYTVRIPRDDLGISIEGMYIPTEAGIESVFYFHSCSCGKTTVLGAMCVTDYEMNDVIDALRAGNIEISSTSQMLIRSQTNPLIVRFQGEGRADELAGTIRAALKWMGKERNEPNPLYRK